jgi:hypothetical protein
MRKIGLVLTGCFAVVLSCSDDGSAVSQISAPQSNKSDAIDISPKQGNIASMKPGRTEPPVGYERKKPSSGMTYGQAKKRLREWALIQEDMPSNECMIIYTTDEEIKEGGPYSLEIHTATKCAPETPFTRHGGWFLVLPDGSIQEETNIHDKPQKRAGPWKAEPKVIDDINKWKHPVKEVFKAESIGIHKLVLTNCQTYATFEVTLPELKNTSEDRQRIRNLYSRICENNAGWSYALDDRRSSTRTQVECAGKAAIGGEGLGW